MSSNTHPTKPLGLFALLAMGIAAVLSLRSMPIAAVYGFSAVTLYVIAAVVFLIPTAYICNRLTLAVPKGGGLYAWVREGLGNKSGLVAIWLEWTNTVISLPTMLTFAFYTGLFPFLSDLNHHRVLQFVLIVAAFWGMTLLNFRGIKVSSWFGGLCVVFGVVLPALSIIGFGIYWLSSGHPIQIDMSLSSLVPSLHFGTLAFLITLVSSLSGIQAIAFHSHDTQHLKHNYPLASALCVAIVIVLLIAGVLSIAIVTPHNTLNTVGGLIAAMQIFLNQLNLGWLLNVFAIMIAVGSLAGVNIWLISPTKGILAASQASQLPKFLSHQNRQGAPTTILVVQAVIFTVLSLIYLFLPTLSTGYWLLMSIFGQLTLLMWLLIFVSAIRLDRKNIWVWITGSLGFLVCLVVFFFGFIPSDLIVTTSDVVLYESLMFIGIVLFTVLPIGWIYLRERKKG